MKTILTLAAGGLFGASLLFSPLSQASQQASQDPSELCQQQANETESTQGRLAAPYFEEDLLPEEIHSAHEEVSPSRLMKRLNRRLTTVHEGQEYGDL